MTYFTRSIKVAAVFAVATSLSMPLLGQYESHEQAKHQQERSDAHHHTKAKVVGGTAAGGAVVGGLLGGGKGAVLGGAAGAGGGLLANKARKDKDIKQRERGER